MWVMHAMSQATKFRLNFRVATLLLLILAVGIALTWLLAKSEDKKLRAGLLAEAKIASYAIEVEHILSLSGSGNDLSIPAYQRIKSQLARMRGSNHQYRFLYLMGQRSDNTVFFFVDSLSAESKGYAPPGLVYKEVSKSYLNAFSSRKEVVVGPITDRWGTSVTALVPMVDPQTKELIAILGMDVDAVDWNKKIVNHCLLPVSSTLLLMIVILVLASHKQARLTIKKNEERYQLLAENISDVIWVYNLTKQKFSYVSSSVLQLRGFTVEEAMHEALYESLLPESAQRISTLIPLRIEQFQKGHTDFFKDELQQKCKDGSVIWIEIITKLQFSEEGAIEALGVSRNITERKQSEKALKKSEEKYRRFFDNCEISLWEEDYSAVMEYLNGLHEPAIKDIRSYFENQPEELAICADLVQILDVNPATLRMYEAKSKHDLLQNLNDVFISESFEVFKEQLISFYNGNMSFQSDATTQTLTGRKNHIHINASLLKKYRVLVTITDITEKKVYEKQKLESTLQKEQFKKLESLKTMAGAIAHRFNNAMMAVQGNLDIMMHTLPADSDGYHMASAAAKAASGASQVGSMMLSYVGQKPLTLQEIPLETLVSGSVTALKSLLQPSISLQFTPPEQPLYCSVDRKQVKEVIESILTNSFESLEDNTGTIKITFGSEYFTTDTFPVNFQNDYLQNGIYVFCQIKDSGHGINPENLSRIFEPFYTTRFVGRGLGLALTVGIMQSHHGAITVESIPEQETTIRVLLPSIAPTQQLKASDDFQDEMVQLSGNILLTDDEEMVLDVGRKMLELLGLTVHTARNGQEAVEKARRDDIDFCAVVLDISMPEMDGIEAMKVIRKGNSTLPILLSSGYSEGDFQFKEGKENKPDGFLSKPFQISDMRSSLEKLLS